MTIAHDESRQQFTATTDSGDAVLAYEREGQRVDFTHTFVPPSARGRGIAEALVQRGLGWAQEHHLQVQASCSYVARYLATHSAR